ncbi:MULTISPECIES: hypothetical protein [Enterococcus]|uniref:hypothetical protein n=1 Tax=Enterococcus TaxID=1350 RepID=UPI0008BFA80A|nr:hypothetical protein [Enterococcus malodoratus]SET88291.1 hypothetical protein SAMN04487821_12711 [Enterococcus malodoratus]
MTRAYEEAEENERKQKEYLINVKGYEACMACGELIAPHEEGHDIAMCKSCQEYQMRD